MVFVSTRDGAVLLLRLVCMHSIHMDRKGKTGVFNPASQRKTTRPEHMDRDTYHSRETLCLRSIHAYTAIDTKLEKTSRVPCRRSGFRSLLMGQPWLFL